MLAIQKHPAEQQAIVGKYEPTVARIEQLVMQFNPISLSEMQHVSLLDRTDTKYVIGMSQLYTVLQQIRGEYLALSINRTCLNRYQTLYFDTSDFALYRQHHNGQRSRHKVREREYIDSDLAFWEVKRKTNRGRTIKSRMQIPGISTDIDDQAEAFLGAHTPFDLRELEAKLWNKFVRITLVSRHRPERLTLDLNLEFGSGDAHVTLPGVAIAEVKQECCSLHSDFIQQMRRLGIRPTRQ